MTQPDNPPSHPAPNLRERAEAGLRTSHSDVAAMPPEDIQHLVHDLQVHQIELRMQNEELRQTQAELGQSHDRFSELYDFAPVGYVTLDHGGTVLEANLTLAAMLGVERSHLVGKKFTRFVAPAAQDTLYLHLGTVLENESKQTCDLQLARADGTTLDVSMESVGLSGGTAGDRQSLNALLDITERKRAGQALRLANAELRARNDELERFNRAGVDRELRMIELKKEINELCLKAGEEPRYRVDFSEHEEEQRD